MRFGEMQVAQGALTVLVVWGLLGCHAQSAAPTDEAHILSEIGTSFKAKDESELASLRSVVASGNHTVFNVYNIALYFSNPSRNEQRFVRQFPSDSSGVMDDASVTASQILGISRSDPFVALGHIADRGNPRAIRKLLLVLNASDGAIAELVGDEVSSIATKFPAVVLSSVASLPRKARGRLTTDPYPWCDSERSMLAVRPRIKSERDVQEAISTSAKRCQ